MPDEIQAKSPIPTISQVRKFATQPKVLAGGLGASLTANVIIVLQEFLPLFEPSTAFVGAATSLMGMVFAWLKAS